MADEPVDHDLKDACADLVKHLDGIADEFIDAFPDQRVLELPIAEIQAFVEQEDPPVDIVDYWRSKPETVTTHLLYVVADRSGSDQLRDEITEFADARVTGYDSDTLYDVGRYRPEDIVDSAVHIRGQVTRRSKRKLRDEMLAFKCISCGTTTRVPQTGDTYTEPHECSGCSGSGPYRVEDADSEMRDYQVLQLQTLPEEASGTETENLEVRLFDDLVGELTPGDRAIATTQVKAKRQGDSRVRELYGDARSIEKLTSDHTDVEVEPYEDDIRHIANGNHPDYADPYEAVIASIAPFHEGDETIKEAIAYQLFGGIEKELPDGSWMRGNSHVLLMGDPGTGKTAIARYVRDLVPRSEYATGKKSTEAGLTASAVKDDFAEGGWTLQAGTLVRAHNGIAVIDELDKMAGDDMEGMIEAMSEQQITVQMVVSGVLPAHCSVLAAANPKHGNFDAMGDVADQIDLDPVILSRFDLKFVMVDEPDEQVDSAVADSMVESARAGQEIAGGGSAAAAGIDPPIPPDMFRAYIALAKRQYPKLTDDAHERIVSEYVDLRQTNADTDAPIPSTARQVEAIIRLSEASARIRLAEEATVDDVDRAIDLLYNSMESLGVDPETGAVDARKFEGGTPSSTHDRRKVLKAIVEGQCTDDPGPDESKHAEHADVKEEAMVLMDEQQFERTLEKLTTSGELYEPRTREYRTTD